MAVPTVTSATVNSDGTTVTIVFSEVVTELIGYGAYFQLRRDGIVIALSYFVVDEASSGVWDIQPGITIYETDTVTLEYTISGGVKSLSTYDPLVEFTNFPVTNNSEESGGVVIVGCETGVFLLTGRTANLAGNFKFPLASGSFAITGLAALFAATRRIIVESGTFALDGNDFGESYTRAIVAQSGQFAVAGQAARLIGPSVSIEADTGDFVVGGGDTEFVSGAPFGCESGLFAITGNPAPMAFRHPASHGEFALTGIDAQFVVQPYFDAQGGLFLLGGGAIAFVKANANAAKHLYFHFLVRS